MVIIKKFGVLSVAKIYALLCGVMGLIVGIFSTILGTALGEDLAIFGAAGIIIFPIIYGVLGFVAGAVGAWLYNLIAGWVGGVEVKLKK